MDLHPVIQSLIAASIICLLSLSGGVYYFIPADKLKNFLPYVVSAAVGILLGNAFLHLIPDAVEELNSTELVSVLTMMGLLLFFFLEKLAHWHYSLAQLSVKGACNNHSFTKPLGRMSLLGDSIHNFTDGALIAVSFSVNPQLGIATTVAIMAHEIPQEIADTGTLLFSGYTLKRSIALNFLSALPALLGVMFIVLLENSFPNSAQYLLPVTAGGFIYIAVSDMMPELQTSRRSNIGQGIAIACGVLFMFLTTRIESMIHILL